MTNSVDRRWWLLFASGVLFNCSAEPESDSEQELGPPTASQNADGTFTTPDGSVVDASGMPVSSAPPTAMPGASTAPTGVPSATATGSGSPATSTGPTSTTPGEVTDPPSKCSGSEVLASKRLVRLTFNQLVNSVGSLLGSELAQDMVTRFELPTPTQRTFPPLNNPREGSVIIDAQWQTSDEIARAAGEHVLANFSEVSECADDADLQCAHDYANSFAERAYRRPLTADELTAFEGVLDTVAGTGATAAEAAQYAVYAALSAPQFLYRTEFGADSAAAGALSPYETASLLSFFISDAPPDNELLKAAASGALGTPEQIGDQVERLLATDAARENLESAMFAYFGISKLDTIVIDPEVAPQFTEGLRASMMHETELFIGGTLWSGVVNDLLTSRTSYINEGLAALYGVEFPPPGAAPDEDGFAQATLPENRAGILTQPGYLTTRSSPEEPSVVRRGLLVNASLLCATNPPFPEDRAAEIDDAIATLGDVSEREKSEFRVGKAECGACHRLFDAYGLALDNFDVIGAYREADPAGRAIDPSVTLPAAAGGATVSSPAQMAAELVKSGAFTSCVSKNLLAYALSEGSSISTTSCATQGVTDSLAQGDQSFASLVRAIAASTTFLERNAGAAQ